jgi:hypothetical protein
MGQLYSIGSNIHLKEPTWYLTESAWEEEPEFEAARETKGRHAHIIDRAMTPVATSSVRKYVNVVVCDTY